MAIGRTSSSPSVEANDQKDPNGQHVEISSQGITWTEEEEKKLVKKIDLFLMPVRLGTRTAASVFERLSNNRIADYLADVSSVIHGQNQVSLKSRLRCKTVPNQCVSHTAASEMPRLQEWQTTLACHLPSTASSSSCSSVRIPSFVTFHSNPLVFSASGHEC